MSSSREVTGPSPQYSFCCSPQVGRAVVITLLALAALSALTLGGLSLLNSYHLLPPEFHFFSIFSPLATGLFLGGGGVLLTGLALYGLCKLICKEAALDDRIQEETPAETEGGENQSQPLSPQGGPANLPLPSRVPLLYAMRLFKNYHPSLAAKCGKGETLSAFLQEVYSAYPEKGGAKEKIKQLLENQQTVESGSPDFSELASRYEKWRTEGTGTFAFFTTVQTGETQEYVLVEFQKANAPSSEELQKYLLGKGDLKTDSTLTHLFHQFLATTETQSLQICKKIYKIGVLCKLLADYPEWTTDPDFRSWVASSLIHLRKGLSSLQVKEKALQSEWKRAVAFLNIIEQETLSLPPLTAPAPSLTPFTPLQMERVERTPSMSYPGIQEVKADIGNAAEGSARLFPPTHYPEFKTKEDLALLNGWHGYLFAHYKKEGFRTELLESETAQFLLHLPSASTAISLLEQLSEEEKEKVCEQIYEIANLTLTLHILSGRNVLHPSRFLALLKALDLMTVYTQRIAKARFQDFTFNTELFHEALVDSYFVLGPYQGEIFTTLRQIRERGTAADLVHLSHDEQLLHLWHSNGDRKNTPSQEDKKRFQNDFAGKHIPTSVARLRSLLLLAQGFAIPQRHLDFNGKPIKSREDIKTHMEGLNKTLRTASKELLQNKSLLSVDSDRKILPLNIQFAGGWEHRHRELLAIIGPPLSPYYTMSGPIKNGEIRTRLAEGMVANMTTSDVDQDGNIGAEVKDEHHEYSYKIAMEGLKQTQLRINEEKFVFPHTSLEASRDLQKMASGRDNRASNALYTFAKYPDLFLQKEHGEDYKRLFRLLIFRGDLLLRELTLNPTVVEQVLANFDKILATIEKTGDLKTWTFLYQAHADLLASLRTSTINRDEREKRHALYTEKLLQWITAVESGSSLYREARSCLHLALLYHHGVLGFSQKELLTLSKSLLMAKTQMEQMLHTSPLEGQILFDLSHRVMPSLIELIEEKGVDILDEILAYRMKGKRTWEKVAKGVYKADSLSVDFIAFQIVQGSQKEGTLPKEIREDDSLKALFGEELLAQSYLFTCVTTPLGKAWHVTLVKGKTTYSLYLRTDDPQFPLLFRSKDGKVWEQRIAIHTESSLPLDFKKGFVWSGQGGTSVEDPSGKKLYTVHFNGESLSKLERHVNNHTETVLDPKETDLFSHLDEGGFVITESPKKVPVVTYLRGNAQYQWNPQEKKWESTIHKGFFLTNKTLNEWISPLTQRKTKGTFFASTFQNFHLLENKEGKGKLILPHQAFVRQYPKKIVSDDEVKYSTTLLPAQNQTSPWEKQTFALFEIEKNGPLKSKRPHDFLYLSYLLFVQGKYGEAMLYLHKSQAVWTAADPEICAFRCQVKDWLLEWKDHTPNGWAFKTKFLKLEHQLRESVFPSSDRVLNDDAEFLPPLIKSAHLYLELEKHVDPYLRLNAREKNELSRLEQRRKNRTEKGLQESLDQEIKFLEDHLAPQNTHELKTPPKHTPLPLFDVSPWLTPIKESEAHQKTRANVDKLASELREIFEGETLGCEIGKEVADDLLRYAAKMEESFTIRENAPLQTLLDDVLVKRETDLLTQEIHLRGRILQQFIPRILTPGESIERQLKEQEALFDHLFEQARHCFGTGDFTSLVEIGALSAEQIDTLKATIQDYEIARTNRLLLTRKKESVQRVLRNPQNSILREECATLLQEWRPYDPVLHPYGNILLLLEDELNITSRRSQMKHIHKLISHPDAYIHEAMAGGKTTFLRNLFSAIEKQKGRLAGVVTYAPLMGMHHREYAGVNYHALGSTAYPIYYNRNAPHDVTALKLMIIYHLKALSCDGRIDQTPQAAISLNHTLTELIRVLHKEDQKTLAELTPSINALQKLLRIRGEYLSVYSDEIDKIFDPMKDFNYAVGGGKVLEKKYYEPALTLVRLMMEVKPLKEFITALKTNPLHLQQMAEQDFEKLLRLIAREAFVDLKLPFDEKMTLDYLTEIHQKDREHPENQQNMVEFYEKTILPHPDQEVVLKVQMLHSFIGVLFRDMKKKIVGADFGRSEDGISVKPFSFSAVCQESSQRSFVLATILEICMDYLLSGVGVEGAQAYVEKMKSAATQALAHEEAEHLDQTKTAVEFETRFGVKLSQVKESDCAHIGKKLESSYPFFEECLREILLNSFTYFEEKIEGNAHHLSHLVGHFSGSSGSPERVKTLPQSIQKHQKLIRQSGAIGSVFYALLKDFEDGQDMIAVKPSEPLAEQLSKHLKPGDTFVDNAPFFPGKKGIEIVETLSKANPTFASFRFLDEDDDVCIWDKEHTRKGEEGIHLDEVISVIPHKGRQGTNWTFSKGKKGIVEAGVATDLTSFYQSLMRLRLLGKGQKGQVLYDNALSQQWAKNPKLQNKSVLAKAIFSFVDNEERLLKNLHFQANRKIIRALRTQALDGIKHRGHRCDGTGHH